MPPKPTANFASLPTQSEEKFGLATLAAELGVDAGQAERIANIQLDAGGQCVGKLIEFIAITKHAPIKAGVIQAAERARHAEEDVVAAVENSLGMFAKRDEQGNVMRADTESKKK